MLQIIKISHEKFLPEEEKLLYHKKQNLEKQLRKWEKKVENSFKEIEPEDITIVFWKHKIKPSHEETMGQMRKITLTDVLDKTERVT